MKFPREKTKIIFMIIVCLLLLYLIFKMSDYLSHNGYIMECFTNGSIQETVSGSTSHTVNLPLNTTYSCQNFCGPTSRCAITGQQCFTDIDCPGCQPKSSNSQSISGCIPGNDDAGKLTTAVTPVYSPLTTGYGTNELIITDNMYEKPAQANFGVDTWGDSFNKGQSLFNKRYKPNQLQYMPNYPNQYSLTGEFVADGPLPSNY